MPLLLLPNWLFLSTPSARRATVGVVLGRPWSDISIHALREEGDSVAAHYAVAVSISIHALREEGDAEFVDTAERYLGFLSTPSARRATAHCSGRTACQPYFYPRPPRGGRPVLCGAAPCSSRFLSTPSARRATSSRARYASTCSGFLSTPSARRATQKIFTAGTLHLFLSTPSARRATLPLRRLKGAERISIHALREEGDFLCL